MRVLLLLLFSLVASDVSACLEAFQFKVYPLGYHEGKIYTLDVQIKRTSEDLANRDYNTEIANPNSQSPVFVLKTFHSVYDKNQKLISTQPHHIVVVLGTDYADTLSKIYDKTKQQLCCEFPKMKKFKLTATQFCDFNQTCDKASLTPQTEGERGFIKYKKTEQPLNALEDESYVELIGETRYQMGILGMGTMKTYKTRGLKLIVIHLVSADQITFKALFPEAESDNHGQEFTFTPSKNLTFNEPLIEHAYGVDVFLPQKK